MDTGGADTLVAPYALELVAEWRGGCSGQGAQIGTRPSNRMNELDRRSGSVNLNQWTGSVDWINESN